jgi:hypothetical protein
MEYAFEIGLGLMISIPSYVKFDSDKVYMEIHRHAKRMEIP